MSEDNIAGRFIKHDRAPEPWEASYNDERNAQRFAGNASGMGDLPDNRASAFFEGLREAQQNPDYQPTSRIGKLIKGLMSISSPREMFENTQSDPQSAANTNSTGVGYRTIPAIPPQSLVTSAAIDVRSSYDRADPASHALVAAQAMASGTNTRDDVRAIEQGTIDLLQAAKGQNPNSSIDRALGIVKADGEVTGNEYKVFQQLVARSGVDLSAVGISDAKQIDTTQELGAAMTAMMQQREQQAGRS